MESDKPILVLVREFIMDQDSKPYVQKYSKWVLERFITWMVRNKIDVSNPRRADIIFYKNTLISEGKTPTTINTYLAPVRKFFQWLEKKGIYENVAAGIRSPKDRRDFRKDYLNPDQVIRLLDLIPKNTLVGLRNYAMINLMLIYALRRIEILRLKISDMESKNDDIVLNIHRKGRDFKEQIKLENEVFEPIQNYLLARKNYLEDEPLFANHSRHDKITLSPTIFSRIVKTYLKKISDSKKLTCHSLRHSTAINLLKAGKSIYDVQQLLGHQIITTTELYLAAIKAESRYNNPLAHEIINLYRNKTKTANNERISV